MNIQDLQPADILLFSGKQDSWVAKAIKYLTESPVSHVALSYTTTNQIIESIMPSVSVNDINKKLKEQKIYVMRLDNTSLDTTPIIKEADKYLNNNEPYALSNLFLLGLILMYKKFTPNVMTKKVIVKILKKITLNIIQDIDKFVYNNKNPMVCSQFVYNCYKNVAEKLNKDEYLLKVKNGNLVRSSNANVTSDTILDRALNHEQNNEVVERTFANILFSSNESREYKVQSDEALAEELMMSLEENEYRAVSWDSDVDNNLIVATNEFSMAVYSIYNKINSESIETYNNNRFITSLNFLKDQQEYFVTPGDLLQKCENISRIGIITKM